MDAQAPAAGPAVSHVEVNGAPCRIWRKGAGPVVGYLAGHGGLPKWIPFLDALAERFTVVAPSLPGYPGGEGHRLLDNHLDWIVAVRDLLRGAGLDGAAALIGGGPGGAFAAEMAALWPQSCARLVLIAPWGLFDEADPMTDPWAQRRPDLPGLMCHDPETWKALTAVPEGANSVEWPIEQTRALEASARAFWPLGNSGLARRLAHIRCPTLLLWGAGDRILPRAYADRFAAGISGETSLRILADAAHRAELDRPDAAARHVADFLAG